MSSNKDETDIERLPLLDRPEDMEARTNSSSIKEDPKQLLSPAAGPEQEVTNMERDENQQNDEGENGTNPIHDGTDNGKNQMMSVVLISIMLVLVAVTVSQSLSPFLIKEYDNPSPTSQDVLIVYMLVGFLIIVAMFLRKHVITEKPTGVMIRGVRDKIKYILRDYLSIVGMSFFFPFACILDLSHVIAAISCDETWRLCGDKFYSDYLVDLFYRLIRILFMGAELAFCCKFNGIRFKESGLVRCGLVIVTAANLGLWFRSLVYEAAERDSDQQGVGKKCSNESDNTPIHKRPENWQVCVNKTSRAHEVMIVMSYYLYPFAIEFSLLVGEFLVTKFVSSIQRETGGPAKSPTTGRHVDLSRQSQTPGSDLVVAQQHQTPEGNVVGGQQLSTSVNQGPDQSTAVCASGHPRPIATLGQLLSVFIIGIGLLTNSLYVRRVFVYSAADPSNRTEIDSLNWGIVCETYSIINYMLINVLIVVGYACGYGLEIQEKTLHGLARAIIRICSIHVQAHSCHSDSHTLHRPITNCLSSSSHFQ